MNVAAAGILLGLTLSILASMGPSVAEVATLSTRSPWLVVLLAVASPPVNPLQLFTGWQASLEVSSRMSSRAAKAWRAWWSDQSKRIKKHLRGGWASIILVAPPATSAHSIFIVIHMFLRLACAPKTTRMISTLVGSTLVGRSGREYKLLKVLQRHLEKPELSVCLAHCNDTAFVTKPVSRSIFELLQELRHEFENHPRLRIHVDEVEEENVVIFEYFKTDLLSLVENYPALPLIARKTILKEIGLALAEMHAKNWIHLDVKPNNIFLNWFVDSSDKFHLEKERNPEGQLGRGVGKASEVFSFALLCIYVITGVQPFHLNFEEVETEPELVVLFKLLSTLRPLTYAFAEYVNDEKAKKILTGLWQVITENEVNGDFADWSEDLFPNLNDDAKRLILRMTNLDPARRAPMSDIITDDYWNIEQK